ncbi:hypothetical protein BKA62DRAFT_609854 [Auriculariales sp. MPI-PUGE-AT-0066]|nr:hypothetical protein BKA62DRAFT_609854 [Auriculariales sp. MPI-PUGE-AT-0066]
MGLGGPAPSTKAPRPLAPERVFKVESEDVRLDDSQLNRLVNGVAVDTSNPNGVTHPRQEKAATVEQRAGILKIVPVTPDGSPQMKILLTGLKTLFQKQLPKMPREYITRLVFDENSRALAIVKRGLKVVGGITFRPFPHRNFAEIVFFATASVDQVRGYGSMLMNHFKMHIRRTYEGMNHFLTYADNYAVGYFRKQGFTKEISLDRSIWAGYIKDYEGGTLMQCEMLPKVDYLRSKEMLIKQREAILATIRARSRAHIVYEGITNWPSTPLDPKTEDGEESPATALARGALLYPEQIPGLKESRWSFARAAQQAVAPPPVNRTAEEQKMKRLLGLLMQHKMAWPFLQAVNPSEVIDYYNVIKHPMDFGTMEHKLETHRYSTLEAFAGDVRLICENCTTYNDQTTIFHKCATQLGKYFETQLSIMEREE